MRGILLFIIMLPLFLFSQENKIELNNISKEKLKNFRINNDKFKDVTYLDHKKNSKNRLYIYITVSDKKNLRFVTYQMANDWLFVKKVIILIDGEKYEYLFSNEKKSVLSAGTVVETSDLYVDDNFMKIIEKINNSNNDIDIRFEGEKGVRDFKLSKNEKQSFKETLELYHSL